MEKLLSIVIPTLNRYQYLKRTLDLIIPQVQRNIEEVELVICCNSSKDETDEYVKSLLPQYPFIRYKYFDEYVEVGQSLIRSVGEATGKFVVLWGDDDIPYPCFVREMLNIINTNKDIGLIHCNRLIGKDGKYSIAKLQVQNKKIDPDSPRVMSLEELVQNFTIFLGFISSLVFRKEDFLSAVNCYSSEHYGFEHLGIIVNGAKGKSCYYYPYPLEIQRVPYNRDFSDKWPLYRFVGIPNMMSDFDNAGITHNAKESFLSSRHHSLPDFIWNMSYTTLNRSYYKKRMKELNKYQTSKFRKILTYLIVYFMPSSLFILLRRKH